MTRKEICDRLPKAEMVLFTLGAMFYDDYTEKGQKPITLDQAEQIPDEVINAICYYTAMDDNIDFVLDPTAFLTIDVLMRVKMSRRPPTDEAETEAKLAEFKAKHKEYFTE
jgi:hypothetical protein